MNDWPLVGRADELDKLRHRLEDDRCRGIVLAGPAGRGKTRLAIECLAIAEAAGAITARATATHSAAGVPFGALASLFAADGFAPGSFSADRTDLLRQLISGLGRHAAGRRLVLMVDDAHLLDDASATLVHRIVETRSAFVVAVVRSGEPAPDSVVALWKDGLTERMEVGGLEIDAIRELLEIVLGGPVDGAAAAYLAERSKGNALFLHELVISAVADGSLHQAHGMWCLSGEPSPSDRLTEIVQSRLGALSRGERTVLEYLAFAEPLGPLEVETLLDVDAAEELESKFLLTSQLDGRRLQIRLAHPVYGDVIRPQIPAMRRAKMARALAEVVEGVGARRQEDVLRVATWRLVGGGGGSPELMIEATRIARNSHDYTLAERLATFAVRAGGGFEAELLVAQLADLRGRWAEAESRLAELARNAEDDDQRGRVALLRLDNVHARSRPELYAQIVDEAEQSIEDQAVRDEIAARRSWLAAIVEGPRVAAEVAEPLLERATGSALVAACAGATLAYGRLGKIELAERAAERGEAAHRALSVPFPMDEWLHRHQLSWALTGAGRLDEAESLGMVDYQAALSDHSWTAQGFTTWTLARIYTERGRPRTATRYARESTAQFGRLDQTAYMQGALVCQVQNLALCGRIEEMVEAESRIDTGTVWATLRADFLQARAWARIALGALPAARALLAEASEVGQECGDLVGAASALHTLARIGYVKDALDPLSRLAAEIEGELTAARLEHVRALAKMDPERLAAVAARFEAIGTELLAAEAFADATTAWVRAGDPRPAAAAQRRSAALFERCEGATTPAGQALDARAQLTLAERETAVLATSGRSNRQIAEELRVSIRTVESRLQHAYEKLGVSGREELAAAL